MQMNVEQGGDLNTGVMVRTHDSITPAAPSAPALQHIPEKVTTSLTFLHNNSWCDFSQLGPVIKSPSSSSAGINPLPAVEPLHCSLNLLLYDFLIISILIQKEVNVLKQKGLLL